MRKLIRRGRPSPAMIVSVIALIMSLAGGAYAASIGIKELSKKARTNTLGAGKLTYVSVTVAVPTTPAGTGGTEATALCPPNRKVVGGGIKVSDDVNMFVNDTHPRTDGWSGTVQNGAANTGTAIVTAICARATRVTGSAPAFKD